MTSLTVVIKIQLKIEQEAQLSLRDRASTLSELNLVKCCTNVRRIAVEKPETDECPSRSFKVTDTGAIRYATYDFLLVFHWKYASILYRFRDTCINTYLRKL